MKKITLSKMVATLDAHQQVDYFLGEESLDCRHWLGKRLRCRYLGRIVCQGCACSVKKSFQQGYCYPCFRKLAACDRCVMSPNLCHYHQGTCREPEWGERHCLKPAHVVYLAQTSHVKVGITRASQLPTRWLDQGANQALAVWQTSNRRLAGLLEVACAEHFSDRTHWQAMLRGGQDDADLKAEAKGLSTKVASTIVDLLDQFGAGAVRAMPEAEVVRMHYPVAQVPDRISSLSLDKMPEWEAVLWGIKGQYWITSQGVFNVRKHTGYEVELSVDA